MVDEVKVVFAKAGVWYLLTFKNPMCRYLHDGRISATWYQKRGRFRPGHSGIA